MVLGSTNGGPYPIGLFVLVPAHPAVRLSSSHFDTVGIGGTRGSTQSREAIEMVLSVDIHRVAFISGSVKDQSDTGWLLAHFLNQD
jgi:hypothetical protein